MTNKNYFSIMQYWYQKRRIWSWFWIRWKSCKTTHVKKVISEKVTSQWIFWLLLLWSKVFGPITSFRWFFCIFFQHIQTQHKIVCLMIPISNCFEKVFLLSLAFFTNFKAKTRPKRLKKMKNKTKNIFYKSIVESHFTSISGLGGYIFSKKSKSFYPSLHLLVAGTRRRSIMWSLHIYCVIRHGNTWYMYYYIFRFICVLKMLLRDGVFCKRVHHKTAITLITA